MLKKYSYLSIAVILSFVTIIVVRGFYGCSKKEKLFFLVDKGVSPYAIVLTGRASQSEKHAANELQHFIKLSTKAELPIVGDNEKRASEPYRIIIGDSELSRKIISRGKPVDWEKLGDDGFILRTVPGEGFGSRVSPGKNSQPDVVIAGGKLRGTMYGVYTFLDSLGFKWYTNRKTWYPEGSSLQMPIFDEEIVPPFNFRAVYIAEAFDKDYAARNRLNYGRLDETRGGTFNILGTHTISQMIPDSLYKEHPEYFPLIGGKRVIGLVQRCLTNQDVIQLTAENMIKWMDSKPNEKIFSLGPASTLNPCECESCVKIVKEQGAQSGLIIDFVNKVAEIVEKKHPDKYISTLAYIYTQKPPKTIKPRNNVMVRICPIKISFTHPLTNSTDPYNIQCYEDLKGWARLTDRITVRHYCTNGKNLLMPLPDFKQFPEDTRIFYENNVSGIFFQGSGSSNGGSDSDLRAWVMARLLWNPYQDSDALVDEWLHNVYGKAYEPMRAYYDLIHAQVAALDCHIHFYDAVDKEIWTNQVVASMDSLHEVALEMVGDDPHAVFQIKKNRMSPKFLQFVLNTGHLEVIDGLYQHVGNTVTEKDYNTFIEYIKENGCKAIRGEPLDSNFYTLLRQRVQKHKVITIENKDISLDIVPELGGRIVSIIYKMTGENILNNFGPEDNQYPVSGGYEETTAVKWRMTGFANQYNANVQERSITLSASTPKGLFERTISLPPKGASIKFSSSITNDKNTEITFCLVCRMHFKTDPQRVILLSKSKNGTFEKPIASEEDLQFWPYPSERFRYDGVNKPAGAWRLEKVSGILSIENTFNEEQVDTCRLMKSEKRNLVLMEITSPERQVPPGGKITIDHTWKIKE